MNHASKTSSCSRRVEWRGSDVGLQTSEKRELLAATAREGSCRVGSSASVGGGSTGVGGGGRADGAWCELEGAARRRRWRRHEQWAAGSGTAMGKRLEVEWRLTECSYAKKVAQSSLSKSNIA
ncbi:uncharacterized protein A4U43_C05F2320 [Asparagus officinalis]|uniref:Uncharacterized protein n=1 Tax=Asparagus officinalis TaxID=4686 RepID=A0A5P1EPS8_ASPOF|nr:uncharacterized protein A4U43_C05F2320 [Asparagus officinalis]